VLYNNTPIDSEHLPPIPHGLINWQLGTCILIPALSNTQTVGVPHVYPP
jgi:hypothetical protein